jgi:hypothetical protein
MPPHTTQGGPGTELASMLSEVGINPPAHCPCHETIQEMDELGVEGCKANRQRFIDRIEANAHKWGWGKVRTLHKVASVGVRSMINGLAWRVNWLDPFPGLVDEAIARAEAKDRQA